MSTRIRIGAAVATVTLALALGAAVMGKAGGGQRWSTSMQTRGSDGRMHTIRNLAKGGNAFLYFIKADCPINAEAIKHYNRLAKAYPKAKFVGVINGDQTLYRQWQKNFKAPFLVLFDPNKQIIGAYRAQASPWVIQINRQGAASRSWEGFSVKDLNQLNQAMAKSLGQKNAQRVSFAGAPANTQYG